jgi:formylglycine-generating enzyme required for sulfatase activity
LIISGSSLNSLNAIAELKSLNSLIIEGGSTWESRTIDLSPIRDLKLRKLMLQGGYVVSTIEPLRDMPLEELKLDYSPITDLSPLKGKQLRDLFLWSWAGSDLSPLKGMPLKQLNIGGGDNVSDLSPLAGAPLEFICINISRVSDLSPLKGSPLKQLSCSNCLVEDLSPLADLPIEEAMIDGTCVRDLSSLTKWPLKWAKFDLDLDNWESVLRKIPSIEKIHYDAAPEVFAAHNRADWNVKAPDFINSRGMEFVLVPKGKTVRSKGNFDQLIGSKEIETTEDFYLGKFEVTQSQWQELMGTNPSFFSTNGPGENRLKTVSVPERGRLPVEKVSWHDCQAFLKKLNEIEIDPEWIYRLPTEAEWTHACHGVIPGENGEEQCHFFFKEPSKSLPSYCANFNRSDLKRTSKVGSFPPNRLGLHDMHGNVWEWCHDQANIPGKQARWIHGGGWRDDAEKCSASFLREPTEDWLYYDLGFRVARVKK